MVEHITSGGRTLATVIRCDAGCDSTTFFTAPEQEQQVGLVVHPAGGGVAPHAHRKIPRRLTGSSEVLVVREGLCELDVYDEFGRLLATRRLRPGDVALLSAGGHGVRMIERTILLEIKQGPYAGPGEKIPLIPMAEAA